MEMKVTLGYWSVVPRCSSLTWGLEKRFGERLCAVRVRGPLALRGHVEELPGARSPVTTITGSSPRDVTASSSNS
ncbi:hypothetical protein Pmani_018504 [Petrolisthes manimaculis]|uniref:Uncharacterized protein n=1 Tax=Petrolisthes manimaculis TaxID=1843537 RepID=A0AAE1PLE7_9EUCA|nr:hypothetical protein Pmani_018504 [Petrolisthes manimaculis]